MNKLFFVLLTLLFTTVARAQTVEDYVAPSEAWVWKTSDGFAVSFRLPVTLGYNRHPELEVDITPHKSDGSEFGQGELEIEIDTVTGVVAWSSDTGFGNSEIKTAVVIRKAIERIHMNREITVFVTANDPGAIAGVQVRLSPSGNQYVPASQKAEACGTACGAPQNKCDGVCDFLRMGNDYGLCKSQCAKAHAKCFGTCMAAGVVEGVVNFEFLPNGLYQFIRFEACTVVSTATINPSFPIPLSGWVEVDGPTSCNGMLVPSDVGCSSGLAGTTSLTGDVVGCIGAFSVAGIHQWPTCGHASGPSMAYGGWSPAGDACSADDICAPGWHVCHSFSEVQTNEPNGCAGLTSWSGIGDEFFATAQSTCGLGQCCPDGTNDIVGCAIFPTPAGTDPLVNCGSLDAYSGEDCRFLHSSWDCGDVDYDPGVPDSYLLTDNQTEALSVQKWTPSGGGVLCCRN